MTVRLKLLVALSAAALTVAHANAGPAERSTTNSTTNSTSDYTANSSGQKPPPDVPVQIMPAGIYPLTPEREQTLRPKDSFKECDACPEMVVIPKGSFIMGTPADEPYRLKGEDPQHRVTFSRPIAVGRFTISFDEWDACVADGGCGGNKGDDRGFGRGRMPAYGIDFAAAKSYLAWLSRKVGRTYRLPSESEREYFARAGTTTPFWFGKTISAQNANYDASNNYPGGPYGESSKGPKPVDYYQPNRFGLYQVNGNAEEWTEDCYNKRYNEDTPADGSPWLEGDCSRRMVRGGGWNGAALTQRSGYRNDSIVVSSNSFRVVRTLAVP
jgi:formylglycine-generating enzyme required for sulfatase activity